MVCPNKPHALHEGPLVKRKWLLWWLFTHSFEFLFLPHRAHSSHNVAATSPISIPCKVFVPHLKRKTRHQTVSMMISEKLPFLDSLQMSVISQNLLDYFPAKVPWSLRCALYDQLGVSKCTLMSLTSNLSGVQWHRIFAEILKQGYLMYAMNMRSIHLQTVK